MSKIYLHKSISDNSEIQIKNVEDLKIRTSFLLPNQRINRYVFSDLVWNNEFFSRYMSINENRQTIKQFGSIFIIFSIDALPNVKANIVNGQLKERYDPYIPPHLKEGDKSIMSQNSVYVRVMVMVLGNGR